MRMVQTLVHLKPEQRKKLKAIGKKLNRSMADLIREGIELLFDEYLGKKES